jgi:hypothetical protein
MNLRHFKLHHVINMNEHQATYETNASPHKVNFGRDPFDPRRAMTGILYDQAGQVFIPSNSTNGNGGLFSYDDVPYEEVEARIAARGHVTFEDVADLGAGEPAQGRVLVKTSDAHTYWIEDGAILDVEDTIRNKNVFARSLADSEKRITIGEPWSYKYRDTRGVLKWFQIGQVTEVAVYDLGFRYGDDASIDAEQPYYDGFGKAKARLALAGVKPQVATQTLLFPNRSEFRDI